VCNADLEQLKTFVSVFGSAILNSKWNGAPLLLRSCASNVHFFDTHLLLGKLKWMIDEQNVDPTQRKVHYGFYRNIDALQTFRIKNGRTPGDFQVYDEITGYLYKKIQAAESEKPLRKKFKEFVLHKGAQVFPFLIFVPFLQSIYSMFQFETCFELKGGVNTECCRKYQFMFSTSLWAVVTSLLSWIGSTILLIRIEYNSEISKRKTSRFVLKSMPIVLTTAILVIFHFFYMFIEYKPKILITKEGYMFIDTVASSGLSICFAGLSFLLVFGRS
jgi:hypothetical protein